MAIIVDERDSNRYYEEDGMIFSGYFQQARNMHNNMS